MPQTPLVTIQSLSQAMGSEAADASSLTGVTGAIERATLKLEAIIASPLRANAIVDTFMVHARSGDPLDGFYRLRLHAPFVRNGQISVTTGDRLSDQSPINDFLLDPHKGILSVPETYLGRYLVATYQSGFLSAGEVPTSVAESIISFTPLMLLAASGVSIESKVLTAALSKATTLDEQGVLLATKLNRRVGALLTPLHSQVTPVSEW